MKKKHSCKRRAEKAAKHNWQRFEMAAFGVSETLQLLGSDPFGGSVAAGLRVPTLPTPDEQHRYYLQLATFTLSKSARAHSARLVGYRQGLKIGFLQVTNGNARLVEAWVTDPTFQLPDGNVSWHLRQYQAESLPSNGNPPVFSPTVAFRHSSNPALLYETITIPPGGIYPELTAYTPPHAGMPWGTDTKAHLGTFYELKTDYRSFGAWQALDIWLEPGMTVALSASVFQPDPTARAANGLVVVAPSAANFYQRGLGDEEQFLLDFKDGEGNPLGIWSRVFGALAVELQV